MKNQSKSIEALLDFSKYLMVTVFAIFAFASGNLLESGDNWTKYVFLAALISSILALNFGFRAMTTNANLEIKKLDIEEREKKEIVESIISLCQKQYWVAVMSLVLLVVSIAIDVL